MVRQIRNHIYVKDADSAITFYKDAFMLKELDNPWRDENGLIIHQNLYHETGELFLSLSDYQHLPNDNFVEKFRTDNCLTMLFYVFFSTESEMLKTIEVLAKDAQLVREAEYETSHISELVCEIIDKFGVFWHFRVPHEIPSGSL